MNRLEEYIRNNKNLFDEEPATGHFERLQQKINHKTLQTTKCRNAERHTATTKILRWSISIAAFIAILFTVGMIWQYVGRQNSVIMVCENANDIKICYLDQMYAVASHIEELVSDFDPWDQQEVLTDVQNIIEAADSDFESELPGELPDDVAKTILSDYYRKNLEGLERIVQSIKN